MRRLGIVFGFWMALAAVVSAQTTKQSQRIYSRQKAFRIPFQIPDPAEQRQLKEVQLYVSHNNGAWKKYTSAPPNLPKERQSFVFRADQDGEYRFSVRTLDRRGNYNPATEAEFTAGLQVVVDSKIPTIRLRPVNAQDGSVGVAWEIEDTSADLSSFKLEYRTPEQNRWVPVPRFVPRLVGQETWLPQGSGVVTVRCQVQDMSKNLGIESITLGDQRSGGFDQRPTGLDPRSVVGEASPRTNAGGGLSLPDLPPNAERSQGAIRQSGGPQLDLGPQGGNPSEKYDGTLLEADPKSTGPGVTGRSNLNDAANTSRAGGALDLPSGMSQNGSPSRRGPIQPSTVTRTGNYPPDRMVVRHSRITMDYALDNVGASGVSQVEVFVTRDRGRSWRQAGMADKIDVRERTHAVTVDLGGEGLYGLAMVAKNGVGFGDTPPRAGEQPQNWIEVDQTIPQVQILQPTVQGNRVVVTWKADDANLDDRPITILVDAGAGVGAKPIVMDLANTGSYTWEMTEGAPYRFRVGVQAVDLAGNSALGWSEEVVVDQSKPRPRIIGIKPAGTQRF